MSQEKPFSSYVTLPSRLTNFQKVLEFNKAFNVKTFFEPQLDIFDKDPKLVEYRLSLVKEEFDETVDAIKNKDFTELVDGLGDIMYVVLGFFSSVGVDADQVFNIIHQSNMSKLCDTEEDAIITVQRYQEEIPQRYDSPTYRKSDCGTYFVVYNKSTSKILKSYKYTPANFTSVLK